MKLMRGTRDISTLRLYGLNGDVGTIQDLYFDDHSWAVRYFIVNTGGWLSGRIVLITPFAVAEIDDATASMRIKLQKEQIAEAPPITMAGPISRQYEEDYYKYYRWKPYWQTDATGWSGPTYYPDASIMILDKPLLPKHPDPPRLCSAGEIIGYSIHARDGEIGKVKDLFVDEEDWVVRYAEIETQKWSSGKNVLAQSRRVMQIDYQSRALTMSLSRHAIQSAPAYDPDELITPDYEIGLFQHYKAA